MDSPLEEFTKIFESIQIPSHRANTYANRLVTNGITTLGQLLEISSEQMRLIYGIQIIGDIAKIRSLKGT
jgi:hypothetical protein